MKIIGIIPARGGSKGIPRKNVRLLMGKTLVSYTIRAAIDCPEIDRVFVSTEDMEIAKISRDSGAEIIWRPRELSDDHATSESAILHVIEYLQEKEEYAPDIIVFLQCTSPLTSSEDISGIIKLLIENDADSAFSATLFHSYLWRKSNSDDLRGVNHDPSSRSRRQDIEPDYLENGAIYVMRTSGFLKAKHRFFGKKAAYLMPLERSHEIDELYDLEVAEMMMRRIYRKQRHAALPDDIHALILDFDGVLTDNRVIVNDSGEESVICNRGDGMGISNLLSTGVSIIVISTEKNPVVTARCNKMGIDCIQGVEDKKSTLFNWLDMKGIRAEDAIYVGNDINDIECMHAVGCGVAVADAHADVYSAARIVLNSSGGKGAVREIIDLIIEHKEA